MTQDTLDIIYDVPFEVTLNTATVGYDINAMEKDKPQNLANNGIVRDGGLTEVYKQSPVLTNPSSVYHTSNGHTIHVDYGDNRTIYVDNTKIGLLKNNGFSFANKIKLTGYADCSISATGTYLCLKYNGIFFVLDEIDDTGTIINTKSANMAGAPIGAYSAVVNNTSNTFANTLYVIYVDISAASSPVIASVDFATRTSTAIVSAALIIHDAQIAAYYVGGGYIFSIYSTQPVDCFLSTTFPINGKSAFGAIYYNNSSITTAFTNLVLYSSSQTTGHQGCGYITKNWNATPGTLKGFGSDTLAGTHGYSFDITYAAGAFVFTWGNAGVTATSGAVFSQNQFAICSQVVVGGNVTILPNNPSGNLATGQAYSLQYACDSVGVVNINTGIYLAMMNSGGSNALLTLSSNFATPGPGNAICAYGDIYNMSKICYYASTNHSGKVLYRNLDGNFTVVAYGNFQTGNIPYSYSELSPGVVQISAAHNENIIDANNRTLNVNCGSFITSSFLPLSYANSASGVTVNYFSYNKYSQCVDNGSFLSCTLNATNDSLFLLDSLTYFYTFKDIIAYINGMGEYLPSSINMIANSLTTVSFVKISSSFTYVPSPYEPIPITAGYDYRKGLALLNNGSAVGIYGMANYDGPNGFLLQKFIAAFRLFGQLYAMDEEYIYNLPLTAGSSGQVGTPVIAALSNGLRFLCMTPQAAIFVSDFDNAIFVFNGGRDVERILPMNCEETILSAAYNVANEEVVFQTATTLLFSRSGIISQIPAPYTPASAYSLQQAPEAVWAVSTAGTQSAYFYKAVAGGTIVPLSLQTSYYGFGSNKMKRVRRFVIRMLFASGISSNVNIAWNWMTDVANGTSTTAVVTPVTDSNGYAIIDYNPFPDYVLGGSLSIWSTDATQKKVLLSITAMIHPDADAQTLNHAL